MWDVTSAQIVVVATIDAGPAAASERGRATRFP